MHEHIFLTFRYFLACSQYSLNIHLRSYGIIEYKTESKKNRNTCKFCKRQKITKQKKIVIDSSM